MKEQEKLQETTAEPDFAAEYEKTLVQLRPGQTVTGKVVQITDDEVCVNVGYKADGLVKKSDLSTPDVKIDDETGFIGDKLRVPVLDRFGVEYDRATKDEVVALTDSKMDIFSRIRRNTEATMMV